MLTRSTRSVRSIHSLASETEDVDAEMVKGLPTRVFEELLPHICRKFRCPFDVYVRKPSPQDPMERYKVTDPSVKRKKVGVINRATPYSKLKKKPKFSDDGRSTPPNESVMPFEDPNLITITSVYDSNDNLVELLFYKLDRSPIHRRIIQAIGVILPLYEMLSKITIRRCLMNMYTVYELNKIMLAATITDICFDDSYLPEANYAILLERSSNLRQLSLSRCKINDVVVEAIADKLHFLQPAEKNLQCLNMSSNRITDLGAKYIGEMLRTNRTLRYLNLAGNLITDEGGAHIFDMLKKFPLTSQEIFERRKRIILYLKRKNELVNKFLTECDMALSVGSFTSSRESGSVGKRGSIRHRRSGSSGSNNKVKILRSEERLEMARSLATQLLGRIYDPFGPGRTAVADGIVSCKGNLSMAYLNVSYNNLSHCSLTKVLDILLYQKDLENESEKGLQKIVLEGNYLPIECTEYRTISELLKAKLCVPSKSKRKMSKERKFSLSMGRSA